MVLWYYQMQDYNADFLVLETWEAAIEFVARARQKAEMIDIAYEFGGRARQNP